MQERWKKMIENLKGTGILSINGEKDVNVKYQLQVYQNMRKRIGIENKSEILGGTLEINGKLLSFDSIVPIEISDRTVLILEDDRSLKIGLKTTYLSNNEWVGFVAAGFNLDRRHD